MQEVARKERPWKKLPLWMELVLRYAPIEAATFTADRYTSPFFSHTFPHFGSWILFGMVLAVENVICWSLFWMWDKYIFPRGNTAEELGEKKRRLKAEIVWPLFISSILVRPILGLGLPFLMSFTNAMMLAKAAAAITFYTMMIPRYIKSKKMYHAGDFRKKPDTAATST